jgi:cytochrome P450
MNAPASAAKDVLVEDDPLYEELYDVRREAQTMGNLVEQDVTPAIAALRQRSPVHKGFLRELLGLPSHFRHVMAAGRPGFSALSFEACSVAFRDPKRFSTQISHHPNDKNEQTLGILEMDGPQHHALRRTIQSKFNPAEALSWWRQRWINDIVARLIERLQGRERAELNLDFCARIPVHTISTAIGMNGDDSLKFRDAYVKSSGIGRTTPELQRAAGATVEHMLLSLIAERRRERRDDLASFLLDAKLRLPDGSARPLEDREIMTHLRLVMIAGGGTSWRQLGITLWALLTHPAQYAEVKADRSLVDAAIEEALRWNPTAPVFSRLVESDTELSGVAMPAGAVLELCLGSANRDESRWQNPDAYDIHRPLLANLAFGLGTHRCLGMSVARGEIAVGINALLDAFPNLRLDPAAPAPVLTGGLEQRGVSGLPVLLR